MCPKTYTKSGKYCSPPVSVPKVTSSNPGSGSSSGTGTGSSSRPGTGSGSSSGPGTGSGSSSGTGSGSSSDSDIISQLLESSPFNKPACNVNLNGLYKNQCINCNLKDNTLSADCYSAYYTYLGQGIENTIPIGTNFSKLTIKNSTLKNVNECNNINNCNGQLTCGSCRGLL